MYKLILIVLIQGFQPNVTVDHETIYSTVPACSRALTELEALVNADIMKHQLKGVAFGKCIKIDEGQVL